MVLCRIVSSSVFLLHACGCHPPFGHGRCFFPSKSFNRFPLSSSANCCFLFVGAACRVFAFFILSSRVRFFYLAFFLFPNSFFRRPTSCDCFVQSILQSLLLARRGVPCPSVADVYRAGSPDTGHYRDPSTRHPFGWIGECPPRAARGPPKDR